MSRGREQDESRTHVPPVAEQMRRSESPSLKGPTRPLSSLPSSSLITGSSGGTGCGSWVRFVTRKTRNKRLTDDFQADDCIHGARLLKVHTTAIVARIRQSNGIHVKERRSVVDVEVRPACSRVSVVWSPVLQTHRPATRLSESAPDPADLVMRVS